MSLEQELQEFVARFTLDPRGFVKAMFPWGEKDLADSSGVYQWQGEVLDYIGQHLKNPKTRYTPCRVAVASGHGIGKSANISQILGWAMATCPDTKVIITANTGAQLKTKTNPEVTKWFNLLLCRHWFDAQATSVTSRVPGHERTWRADFMTWNEKNPQAMAGLHNAGKRIVIIFDEASGIATNIWEVIEGALTDLKTQIIWIAYGNPEQPIGRFRDCFSSLAHLWKTWQIDSRSVPNTNKELFEQWRLSYGEDSPFFKIRVKGEFCTSGINQLISIDIVDACRKYAAEGYQSLPLIAALDVARFGDDRSSLVDRQGRKIQLKGVWRNLDTVQLANKAAEYIDDEKPDAFVVDGDGIGAGVIDVLKHRGYAVIEFHGGAAANDSNKYFNHRSEVWGLMSEGLKEGSELPGNSPYINDFAVDLTGPQYGYNSKQQLQLESKDDMKKRGVASPDIGDAAAMTYGLRIAPAKQKKRVAGSHVSGSEHGWMQ